MGCAMAASMVLSLPHLFHLLHQFPSVLVNGIKFGLRCRQLSLQVLLPQQQPSVLLLLDAPLLLLLCKQSLLDCGDAADAGRLLASRRGR